MKPHSHTGHETCHSHGVAPAGRAFAIGVALNTAFVIGEALSGWHFNSLALLADAGHNLTDVAGLLLAWSAAAVARRRPDHRYTYGHQRASIVAAFANAALLLGAMGALLLEAVHRLQDPQPTAGLAMISVAAIGVLINGATALLFLHGRDTDLNIRGAFLHMAADALVSLGVVIAGVLYLLQGWTWIDPVASMLVALAIMYGTWGLARQSLHLLFDGVPPDIDLAEVRGWLQSRDGVASVHDLHVWALSTTGVALTAHLVMPGGHPGDAFFEALGRELKHRFGIAHPTLQVELAENTHGCDSHQA